MFKSRVTGTRKAGKFSTMRGGCRRLEQGHIGCDKALLIPLPQQYHALGSQLQHTAVFEAAPEWLVRDLVTRVLKPLLIDSQELLLVTSGL